MYFTVTDIMDDDHDIPQGKHYTLSIGRFSLRFSREYPAKVRKRMYAYLREKQRKEREERRARQSPDMNKLEDYMEKRYRDMHRNYWGTFATTPRVTDIALKGLNDIVNKEKSNEQA